MPPDAPQPRLIVVAKSLRTNKSVRSPAAVMLLSSTDWMTP